MIRDISQKNLKPSENTALLIDYSDLENCYIISFTGDLVVEKVTKFNIKPKKAAKDKNGNPLKVRVIIDSVNIYVLTPLIDITHYIIDLTIPTVILETSFTKAALNINDFAILAEDKISKLSLIKNRFMFIDSEYQLLVSDSW